MSTAEDTDRQNSTSGQVLHAADQDDNSEETNHTSSTNNNPPLTQRFILLILYFRRSLLQNKLLQGDTSLVIILSGFILYSKPVIIKLITENVPLTY